MATTQMWFVSKKGSEYLRVTTEYNLYKIIKQVEVCTKFKLLKVKVPIIFLGTAGFLLRRDRR
jgi:hypothetical protein